MTDNVFDLFGSAPDRLGLFCDFDGTLSEIADDHVGARPLADVPALLDQLVPRVGRVAIISGRPVAYLAEHLPDSVDLVGLYGLEWRAAGTHHTLPAAEEWRPAIRAESQRAVDRFGPSAVESKGLSLTVHFRSSGAESGEVQAFVQERATVTGLDWRPARKSFELHPPIARDKGSAVLDMARDLDPVVYVGDDLGDLPAFDGLDELRERGVSTLRVAVDSDEAPPILLGRADLVVAGPGGVEALLQEILRRTAPPTAASG